MQCKAKRPLTFLFEMQALGIPGTILGELWEGKLTVQNKPGRRERVKALTTELRKLESGCAFSCSFISRHSQLLWWVLCWDTR